MPFWSPFLSLILAMSTNMTRTALSSKAKRRGITLPISGSAGGHHSSTLTRQELSPLCRAGGVNHHGSHLCQPPLRSAQRTALETPHLRAPHTLHQTVGVPVASPVALNGGAESLLHPSMRPVALDLPCARALAAAGPPAVSSHMTKLASTVITRQQLKGFTTHHQ